MKLTVDIDGKEFSLVKAQRAGDTAVYKHADQYLRIGDREKIMQDLALHKKMESGGFPVAKLLAEGEYEEQYYYIESSLGNTLLSQLFGGDVAKQGNISDEHFSALLDVTRQFTKAQLSTVTTTKDFGRFADAIHLDILCQELPDHASQIRAYFEKVKSRLAMLPFVQSHGDFNPHNLFPKGVIDLEVSFTGPFGYDLVSAISSINYFPDSKEYEFFASYRFTETQKGQYYQLIDSISVETGIPPISQFAKDLEFCRAVWLLVKMQKWPKLQAWRYKVFIDKFLVLP